MTVPANAPRRVPGEDDPLRMGLLNAALAIQDYRLRYPGSSAQDAARTLRGGLAATAAFPYADALALEAAIPRVLDPQGQTRTIRMRRLIEQVITLRLPTWARLIPRGRRYLAAYLPTNALQCFENAGMYDTPLDADAIVQWERLNAHFRSLTDAMLSEKGRIGEQLTIDHETARLISLDRADLVPQWVAIEDNSLGYDVLSHSVDSEGIKSRYIEVKATAASPPRFFLTRNEWRAALAFDDRYRIHLWLLPQSHLVEIKVPEISVHVPPDIGRGQWQTLEITWVHGAIEVAQLMSPEIT